MCWIILTEASKQLSTAFIAEPENRVFVKENATAEVVWKLVDCDPNWQVRIVTENYTLYPNLLPGLVPIKNYTDYNVTVICENEHKTVNLSITFNVIVHQNIKYVICKAFKSSNDAIMYPSRVTLLTLSSTFTSEPTTTITPDNSFTKIKETVTMIGSGCRLSVHLVLSLFIAISALSLAS